MFYTYLKSLTSDKIRHEYMFISGVIVTSQIGFMGLC